ncbi:Nickel-dependent lactate racemase [Desulfocicer vacuolatum DSM 3385]|uniref:Nickel-dependent lactate racemase n=1 Tax=Desulfocicer vacuolatum DSM 3385 TaxID=1121400 RepID=A0A1W1YM25_9BACT|nr:nickel-dependent lactate racemase [Desulfocicer vacuolatum]SMC37173.1 Nickel-dependent lactate racemase [Desulfocicer vacuolatum DSM 3385]
MKISVPYGKKGELTAEINDTIAPVFLEANDVNIGDTDNLIKGAMASPHESPDLSQFLGDAKDLLIIVNDATRPTPTKTVLDAIWDDIKDIPVKFIIATGAHRGPSEEEYVQIFGSHYENIKDKIIVHDALKDEEMVFLGTSSNGTEMSVHEAGVNAHKIIIIGSVEPHYFAGYTGGRKSFLPGIASYKTIEQNHKLALGPEACALALEGNPVHEDMVDALKVVKKEIFAIMTVLDKNHKVYAVTAGDIYASFDAAIERANEVFCAPIEKKADIVVSVVKFPADIDLYQAQKGIDNAKLALKENGILILVAKCRCGIGGKAFADLLGSCDTPQEVLDTIEKGYKLGYHKAAKMAEIGRWAEMWGVTDVPDEELSQLFIRPFDTLQEALDKALEQKGANADVMFLMDGSLTVPMLQNK